MHARLREAGVSAAPRKEAVAEPGEVLSVSSYLSFRERYATAFAQNPCSSIDIAARRQARRNRYRCVLDQTERVVHRCVIAVNIAAIVQLL